MQGFSLRANNFVFGGRHIHYAWVTVAVAATMRLFSSSFRSSSSILIPRLVDSFGWSYGAVGFGFALQWIVSGLLGPPAGWLGDRYGTIGLIWGTKGLTAMLLATSLVVPPLAMAPLMIALGMGLNGTSSVLYATVAEFVPAQSRARLYGIYYTTNEGGTVLAPLFYGFVADLVGIRLTMVVMAILTTAILPVSLALRKYLAPKGLGIRARGA